MKEVRILVDIDADEIADSISELPYDDILEIIKRIDTHIADWGFTKSVFEYYQKEIELLNSDDDNKSYARGHS